MTNFNSDTVFNEESVFSIASADQFNAVAIHLFHFQYKNNAVYRQFVDLLKLNPENITRTEQIPFLPIRFFKSNRIVCKGAKEVRSAIFTSSGTTGAETSRHFVADITVYEKSFLKSFREFYGDPSSFTILALLPSYLERSGSSLVYMADKLIQLSNKKNSGFYLYNHDDLHQLLLKLEEKKEKVLLLGVSFALLDFCEKFKMKLENTIVMETGGMKGRGKEITREELHQTIKNSLGVKSVHSEYGMTELLSQAYSKENGIFNCPPQMKICISSMNDPFEQLPNGLSGKINIIDLANIYSCAFIATDDLGKKTGPNQFEILGRMDLSDLRGCSLLLS